ncbi:helix-turn-helix transcriptional regulator [Nocardia sp. NRRL WC-3656]|uniref:helix-turn-helix domain-containing protein n=1 Tax=Nocardia sp. NRRL WC-3656 TaxID=1463824 RepID=UPI0018CC092B|nr:helix-turn-helix transcriptional regulator [Nocardia sp. NRRL WC-3656]
MQTTRVWSIAELVSMNLARIRDLRRLTVRQLSERLSDIGAPMLPSGITNVEKGKRGVSLENLLAFAAVLNASPADFLDAPERDRIAISQKSEPVTPYVLRSWLADEQPLFIEPGSDYDQTRREQLEAAPTWKRRSWEREQQTFRHPARAALSSLTGYVTGAILEEDGIEPELLAQTMRESLEQVSAYVGLLADEVERRARSGDN